MNFVSTVGKAGLSCETAQGAYWIWIDRQGAVSREFNCRPVSEFPASARKARTMESLFTSLQADMLSYLNATDTAEGSRVWWSIKDRVKAAE